MNVLKRLLLSTVFCLLGIQGQQTSGFCPPEDHSLEEMVGQMLLLGFRGTSAAPDSEIVRLIKRIHLGGVVLFDFDVPSSSFPRNIQSPSQVRRLISSLQSQASIPLLVAVDAEGGRINRLKPKYGFADIPSAQSLGRANPEQCRRLYTHLAGQLRDLGFNLNLAPVVDLNLYPQSPAIGALERSFSANPDVVISRAALFMEAHHRMGISTCLKHFPGHGSARKDSHRGLVDITDTFEEQELLPYRSLIRSGSVAAVMTAHIWQRDIDPEFPATLSPRFLQDILRTRLGFTGVIISDDLQMGAITQNFGFAQALIQAVRAGCDILAIANNSEIYDPQAGLKAHRLLVTAVQEGKIPLSTIRASFRRVLRLKQKFTDLPGYSGADGSVQ